jgi:hypothetical protein
MRITLRDDKIFVACSFAKGLVQDLKNLTFGADRDSWDEIYQKLGIKNINSSKSENDLDQLGQSFNWYDLLEDVPFKSVVELLSNPSDKILRAMEIYAKESSNNFWNDVNAVVEAAYLANPNRRLKTK